jgi:hypothetical protein
MECVPFPNSDDESLWKTLHIFHIESLLDFWSPALVRFPFGSLCLAYPDDEVCLLHGVDYRDAHPGRIIHHVEHFTHALGLASGFTSDITFFVKSKSGGSRSKNDASPEIFRFYEDM